MTIRLKEIWNTYIFFGYLVQYKSDDLASIQQAILKQIFANQDFLPMMNELCNTVGMGKFIFFSFAIHLNM